MEEEKVTKNDGEFYAVKENNYILYGEEMDKYRLDRFQRDTPLDVNTFFQKRDINPM